MSTVDVLPLQVPYVSAFSYLGLSPMSDQIATCSLAVCVLEIRDEVHLVAEHGRPLALAALQCLRRRLTSDLHVQTTGQWDKMLVFTIALSEDLNAEQLRSRLDTQLARHIVLAGKTIVLDVRVAVHADDSRPTRNRIQAAEDALSMTDGRRRVVVADGRLRAEIDSRQQMSSRIENLLASGALQLAYQPIRDLASGEILAVEALARLADPELGLLSPGDFLPSIEELGLHDELVQQVVLRCCGQIAAWRRFRPSLRMCFNARAADLEDDRLARVVQLATTAMSVDPSALIVEIIETHMAHPTMIEESLTLLRSMGVRIAVDDFGTGFSSVSQVQHLQPDFLKIDGRFASSVSPQDPTAGVIELAIKLANEQGLIVVCEGIEESYQVAALRSLGCAYGQGYFLGRPGTAADIEQLLRSRPARLDSNARHVGSARAQ